MGAAFHNFMSKRSGAKPLKCGFCSMRCVKVCDRCVTPMCARHSRKVKGRTNDFCRDCVKVVPEVALKEETQGAAP